MADSAVIETFEQAVAWLRQEGMYHHDLVVKNGCTQILAVLEREHEEAERLREALVSITGLYSDGAGAKSLKNIASDALSAARKGVSDE